MDKLDLEIGGGWTIVQGTSFLPVTKRVPHVVEEEHGRKKMSLPRGSACVAGYLADCGWQIQERSRSFQDCLEEV